MEKKTFLNTVKYKGVLLFMNGGMMQQNGGMMNGGMQGNGSYNTE